MKRAAAMVAQELTRRELEDGSSDVEDAEDADFEVSAEAEEEEEKRRKKQRGAGGAAARMMQEEAEQKARAVREFAAMRADTRVAREVLERLNSESARRRTEARPVVVDEKIRRVLLQQQQNIKETFTPSNEKSNNEKMDIEKSNDVGNGPSREALEAARKALATVGKVAVSESVRFAGRVVTVTRHVEKSSGEAKRAAEAEAKKKAGSGLDRLVQGIAAKKTVTAVTKSSYDWEKFKQDQGEDMELEKGAQKNGFIEKQSFLQRVDVRQFEKEREARAIERARRAVVHSSSSDG